MVVTQSFFTTAALLLLGSVPVSLGHGHGNDGADNSIVNSTSLNATSTAKNVAAESYFSYQEHGGLALSHIVLMMIAWVFVLPIGRMIVSSDLGLKLMAVSNRRGP